MASDEKYEHMISELGTNKVFYHFSELKCKLYGLESLKIYEESMEKDIDMLFQKCIIHIGAIECLLTNNPYDPFSIIPLVRLCTETYSIMKYIREPSNNEEQKFRWLVWCLKSYKATESEKYTFQYLQEGEEFFKERLRKYNDQLENNKYYSQCGKPPVNQEFYKENLPGWESLYKQYFPIGKLYNQFSWVAHPTTIGCRQMAASKGEYLDYSICIIQELNMLISQLILEHNPSESMDLVIGYDDLCKTSFTL